MYPILYTYIFVLCNFTDDGGKDFKDIYAEYVAKKKIFCSTSRVMYTVIAFRKLTTQFTLTYISNSLITTLHDHRQIINKPLRMRYIYIQMYRLLKDPGRTKIDQWFIISVRWSMNRNVLFILWYFFTFNIEIIKVISRVFVEIQFTKATHLVTNTDTCKFWCMHVMNLKIMLCSILQTVAVHR